MVANSFISQLIIISLAFLITISFQDFTADQKKILNEIKDDEGFDQAPYMGGFNSNKAKLLIVKFTPDPSLYGIEPSSGQQSKTKKGSKSKNSNAIQRTFKEMVKDLQELLLTAGVHCNIFKSKDYEITVAVNDEETAIQVRDFYLDQPQVESVRYNNKTRYRDPEKLKQIRAIRNQNKNKSKQEEL